MREGVIEGYKDLAWNVLCLALKDYEYTLENLRIAPDNKDSNRMLHDCERFFGSLLLVKLYAPLADVDEETYAQIVKEVRHDVDKRTV